MKMLLLLSALFVLPAVAQLNESTRSAIDTAAGVKGAYTAEENVHRVSFPRADIKITIEDRPAHPFMGFGSWAAFTPGPWRHDGDGRHRFTGRRSQSRDVGRARQRAGSNGSAQPLLLRVAARDVHAHWGLGRRDEACGSGEEGDRRPARVRTASAQPARAFAGQPVPTANQITSGPIDQILGVKGESNNGMYKATIGRTATHHGTKVGKTMGVNTWAAFAGTDQYASVDGDFAMTEDELQGVLKTLRKNGIHIVAIHNHMTHEQPRYVFLHYWGKGPAADLARAVRAAMDTQKK
jgi:hypothetical protein